MTTIQNFFILNLVFFFTMYATFRHKFAGTRRSKILPLADCNLLIILSLILVATLQWLPIFVYYILISALFLMLVIYVLDANMTKFMGIEVTIWSIYFYITHKEMMDEQKGAFCNKYKIWLIYLIALALCAFLSLAAQAWGNTNFSTLFVSYSLLLSLLCIFKSSPNKWLFIALTVLFLLLSALAYYHLFSPYVTLTYQAIGALLLVAFIISNICRLFFRTAFLNSDPYFLSFFRTKALNSSATINLHKTTQKSGLPSERDLKLPYAIPEASSSHGLLKNKNIIVLMHESVTDQYFQGPNSKASLPYFNKLSSKINIDCHIAISPNTSSSFQHLFSGAYGHDAQYPYIKALKKEGYNSLALINDKLTVQPIYHRLLTNIGFNNIICSTGKGGLLDHEFYQQELSNLKKEISAGPFFLMVQAGQTHIPYRTSGQQPAKLYDRYFKSCQEADAAFAELMESLSDTIDIDDTLIVYTSDHGQSFGELGYSAHSTSIIKEQINVPCAFHHKKLKRQTIKHASHFDLMPTIFDLLGIELQTEVLGRSILAPDHYFKHLLYSTTRKANAPSCFGLITEEGKYFRDLVYNSNQLHSLDDQVIKVFHGEDAKYMDEFYYQALNNAGLLGLLFKEYGEA